MLTLEAAIALLKKPVKGSCWYQDRCYFPIMPQADDNKIVGYSRLMLRHSTHNTVLEWEDSSWVCYGIVIGLFSKKL